MHDLLEAMPASELTGWEAYEQVSGPLGQPRDDILTGIVAERITSMLQGGKRKHRKKWTVDDFVPKWGRAKSKRAQSPQEQRNMLLELTRRFGGTVRR